MHKQPWYTELLSVSNMSTWVLLCGQLSQQKNMNVPFMCKAISVIFLQYICALYTYVVKLQTCMSYWRKCVKRSLRHTILYVIMICIFAHLFGAYLHISLVCLMCVNPKFIVVLVFLHHLNLTFSFLCF